MRPEPGVQGVGGGGESPTAAGARGAQGRVVRAVHRPTVVGRTRTVVEPAAQGPTAERVSAQRSAVGAAAQRSARLAASPERSAPEGATGSTAQGAAQRVRGDRVLSLGGSELTSLEGVTGRGGTRGPGTRAERVVVQRGGRPRGPGGREPLRGRKSLCGRQSLGRRQCGQALCGSLFRRALLLVAGGRLGGRGALPQARQHREVRGAGGPALRGGCREGVDPADRGLDHGVLPVGHPVVVELVVVVVDVTVVVTASGGAPVPTGAGRCPLVVAQTGPEVVVGEPVGVVLPVHSALAATLGTPLRPATGVLARSAGPAPRGGLLVLGGPVPLPPVAPVVAVGVLDVVVLVLVVVVVLTRADAERAHPQEEEHEHGEHDDDGGDDDDGDGHGVRTTLGRSVTPGTRR